MTNITITENSLGGVVIEPGKFQDDLLTVGGAGTTPEGTILARDSATLKLIPFVKGGSTNGNGIPKTVLQSDIVAAGAGDESFRSMLDGVVSFERLIIAADGDNSNVDKTVIDELRSYGVTTVGVQELNTFDNS